jgi:hypothetical protein
MPWVLRAVRVCGPGELAAEGGGPAQETALRDRT